MRRLAVELRSTIIAILRAIDVEGALLLFAVAGATVIAYTFEWRWALLVLVLSAATAGIVLARAPRSD